MTNIFDLSEINRITIKLFERMNIPNSYYGNQYFYTFSGNKKREMSSLSYDELVSAVAAILEKKPYLAYYHNSIGLNLEENASAFCFFSLFSSLIDSDNPKDVYIEKCLTRPFLLLDTDKQFIRFFFMDMEYSLLLREQYIRYFKGVSN